MTDKQLNKTEYYDYELHSDMRGKKLKDDEIEQAKTGKRDYTSYDPITGIGLTEAKGDWRADQEDRSDFTVVAELMHLDSQQIKEVLLKSIVSVQQTLGSHHHAGSTLVTAIIIKSTIYVANVGDSNAILLLADKANNVICHRINILHNPLTHSEYEYINKADGYISHGRLGGMLAVSRAIGDNDFEKFGLRHTPDIFTIDITTGKDQDNNIIVKPNQKVLGLLLACDGLHEEDPDLINMTDRVKKYLHDIDKAAAKFNSQQLSQLLVNGAYQDRSQDNLTAMIIPIDIASASPIIAIVADGHGGDEVSEALRQAFIAKVIELASNK